jgi:hypothetical protein
MAGDGEMKSKMHKSTSFASDFRLFLSAKSLNTRRPFATVFVLFFSSCHYRAPLISHNHNTLWVLACSLVFLGLYRQFIIFYTGVLHCFPLTNLAVSMVFTFTLCQKRRHLSVKRS